MWSFKSNCIHATHLHVYAYDMLEYMSTDLRLAANDFSNN